MYIYIYIYIYVCLYIYIYIYVCVCVRACVRGCCGHSCSQRVQRTLAFRWILEVVRAKKGRPFHMSLAAELVAAYNREGNAMLKRENTHKQAEANKAFAHFAW